MEIKETDLVALNFEYDLNEARKNFLLRMEISGFEASYPGPKELQIDIDSEESKEIFLYNFAMINRNTNWKLTYKCTPSKSGHPCEHIRIQLPFEITDWERIAWQASLGSDTRRELLSCLRKARGDLFPSLLVEVQKNPSVF